VETAPAVLRAILAVAAPRARQRDSEVKGGELVALLGPSGRISVTALAA
jgi:ABC-type sulfate/molybdate transport systems ATPase subunit